jgi:hypothetical protein
LHGDLIFVIESVSTYQFNLTVRGLLLRGATTRGLLYMDKEVVIGQAINEASEIEGRAIYPRVIVSTDCVDVINSDKEWIANSLPVWNDCLLVDEDDEVFINYIATIEYDGEPEDITSGLHSHGEIIRKGLIRHPSGKIREKYVWLAHLHNFVIDELYPPEQWAKIGSPDLTEAELSNRRRFTRFPRPSR